jgi:hypothetical protein
MTAQEVLSQANAGGVDLVVIDGRLKASPPRRTTAGPENRDPRASGRNKSPAFESPRAQPLARSHACADAFAAMRRIGVPDLPRSQSVSPSPGLRLPAIRRLRLSMVLAEPAWCHQVHWLRRSGRSRFG